MNLVADKNFTAARGIESAAAALPSDRWADFPVSRLSHHGAACCDIARQWVIANDFAQLNGGEPSMGPRWMRERYEWGPSIWPLRWCEAVGSKVIDCGAHAALAHEAFVARGLTAYRAQFVQRYSRDATDQWRRKWAGGKASDHWLGDDLIYHEGNALRMHGRDVKLWDGSAGWWLNPRQAGGYASVVSVRIFAPGEIEPLQWGEHRIEPNSWHELDGPIHAPAPNADQPSAFFRK